MYDIIRLAKRIRRRVPRRALPIAAACVLFLIILRPLITAVSDIIDPPLPTETPRPTPFVSQTGVPGEPLHFLESLFTLLDYGEYDSHCVPLEQSVPDEGVKTVVLEFSARNYASEPVKLSNFFLRDGSGTNYALTPALTVGDYRGTCTEPLSEGMQRPAAEMSLSDGYGIRMYLYARNVPLSAAETELTFTAAYSIPYPAGGSVFTGSSKLSIPAAVPENGTEVPDEILGVPDPGRLSPDRTARIGGTAVAVSDAYRIAGDNGGTQYYLELLFRNDSGKMMDLDFASAFDLAVLDDCGVAVSAALSLNRGYNSSFMPDEVQKYALVFSMEQTSVRLRNLYLRIRMKDSPDGYAFIRIPFKESMLITPTPTPDPVRMLHETPLPGTAVPMTAENGAPDDPCRGVLPALFAAGDEGSVTYDPPVSNRVRREPGLSGDVSGLIGPGEIFQVLSGPVCRDGYHWYLIRYRGGKGWTAESGDGRYWLERTR